MSVVSSNLTVGNQTLFSNNESEDVGGLAINCKGCSKVDVKNSQFKHMNTGAKGGAVSLDKSCGAALVGNEF